MQYTASSFAQPLMDIAGGLIGVKEHLHKPEGFFPRSGSFSSHAPDRFTEGMWRPLFAGGEWLLKRFRWMQAGSIHLYVLYIAITLLFLLLTMLG